MVWVKNKHIHKQFNVRFSSLDLYPREKATKQFALVDKNYEFSEERTILVLKNFSN